MEGDDVESGGTEALLAKTRRLVLVSRNLVRLLARRIDMAEQLKSRTTESLRLTSGRGGTMGATAGGD
jgi:hypothetical protein